MDIYGYLWISMDIYGYLWIIDHLLSNKDSLHRFRNGGFKPLGQKNWFAIVDFPGRLPSGKRLYNELERSTIF